MNEFIGQLIQQYPGAFPISLVAAGVVAAWHISMTYNTFRYMKASMATKKDLEIALLKYQIKMDERYARKSNFPAAERS